jgi:hypothetical protein
MKNKKYILAMLIVIAIFSMNFGMKQAVKTSYKGCNTTNCHAGNPLNDATIGFVDVTSDIPLTGWMPNATYNITVTATATDRYAYGFQFTTWGKTDSVTVGKLATVDSDVQISKSILKNSMGVKLDSNYYATHVTSSVTHGSTRNMWMFQWTAPAVKSQEVRFYLTAVCANASGSPIGDYVYRINKNADSSSIKNAAVNPVGIEEIKMAGNVFIYPTIITNDVNISAPYQSGKATVSVIDITGKILLNKVFILDESSHTINLSELETGTYIITVQGANINFSKKIIKI